jgi:hypothetical protein
MPRGRGYSQVSEPQEIYVCRVSQVSALAVAVYAALLSGRISMYQSGLVQRRRSALAVSALGSRWLPTPAWPDRWSDQTRLFEECAAAKCTLKGTGGPERFEALSQSLALLSCSAACIFMHVDYSRLRNRVAIKLDMKSSDSANNKGLHDISDSMVNPARKLAGVSPFRR